MAKQSTPKLNTPSDDNDSEPQNTVEIESKIHPTDDEAALLHGKKVDPDSLAKPQPVKEVLGDAIPDDEYKQIEMTSESGSTVQFGRAGVPQTLISNDRPNRRSQPFINLLNNDGVPVPVIHTLIPYKLVEGYQFIEGESAQPALAHKTGPVYNRRRCHARPHIKPASAEDAVKLLKRAIDAGRTGPIDMDDPNRAPELGNDAISQLMTQSGIGLSTEE